MAGAVVSPAIAGSGSLIKEVMGSGNKAGEVLDNKPVNIGVDAECFEAAATVLMPRMAEYVTSRGATLNDAVITKSDAVSRKVGIRRSKSAGLFPTSAGPC